MTTCVSGYWAVKNKHDDKYNEWFKNTLLVNCPYIFFSDKEGIECIKQYRKDLPTYFVELEIKDFYTYKYKDTLQTDPEHCPSVELSLIWHEKLFLIKRASELNPFNSEWFHWIDAGHCIYRIQKPPSTVFPNAKKMKILPKDKFIYSSSNPYDHYKISKTNWGCHHVSGTSYMIHNTFINTFVEIYNEYLQNGITLTDQITLTHIYKDNRNLFHNIGDGYGEITRYLY
jgi:hypothetical protein